MSTDRTPSAYGVTVVPIPSSATHDLRWRVLRDSRPGAEVAFPEDERPGGFHLGALAAGRVVGVASFSPAAIDARPGRVAYQLRGMAVDPQHRGAGVGRSLLTAAVARLRGGGAEVIWAHARDSALDFYRRQGWAVVGDGYVHGATAVPHHLAVLDLRETLIDR